MSDSAFIVFEDLSKAERTALRKLFCKQNQGGKVLIIAAVVIAAALIAVTVLAIVSKYMVDFASPSISVSWVLILIALRERRFRKWLEGEKHIMRRRVLKKKEKKSKQ